MEIAYLQCYPRLGDKDFNIEHLDSFLRYERGVDVVVLPELCNVGYAFLGKEELMKVAEDVNTGVTIKYLKQRAKSLDMLIIAGFAESASGQLYNSAAAVFPDGKIEIYRKTHLFNREKDLFAPGDTGFKIFEYKGVKMAMIVCFDWIFPETWRTLALQGVQVVCMCANLVLPGKAQKGIPAMCMMNRYFAVCANRIGREQDLLFTGLSMIADPEGEILVQSDIDNEELRNVTIDPSRALDKWVTPRNHLFQDRRPEFYKLQE